MEEIRNIYKNIWKSILWSYYLNDSNICRTSRTFEAYNEDVFLFYNKDGMLKALYKKELYNLFIKNGFMVTEQANGKTVKVYFSISKEQINNLMKEEKEKRKMKKKNLK